jgi:cobyric acid synthase
MVLWQGAWIDIAAITEEALKAIAQTAEANVFLLQPQPGADTVVAQIVVEGSLLGRQPVQIHPQ